MSVTSVPQPAGMDELLRRCRMRIQVQTAVRGLADTVRTLAVCVLVGCVVDFLIPLPGTVRLILLMGFVGAAVTVFWRRLAGPLLKSFPAEELGAAVDLTHPDLKEGLASLIAFQNPELTEAEAGSALMRMRLCGQVESALRNVEERNVVTPRSMIRRCGYALVPILFVLLPVLFWPSGSQLLLQRLLLPLANLSTVSNLYFEVPSANRWVVAGSDVRFEAIPRWRTHAAGPLPQSVSVELETRDGHRDSLPMEYDESGTRFLATLPAVRMSLRYRISGGGFVSEWFDLNVAEPPRIVAVLLTETPPAYTGRPIELFDGAVGNIPVFERSQIDLVVQFSKPAAEAKILWQDWSPITSQIAVDELSEELVPDAVADSGVLKGTAANETLPIAEPVQWSADRLTATFRWTALGSGRFEIFAADERGLPNPTEPERLLEVAEDKAPILKVTGVTDELKLRPDDVLPLNCSVADDIGVGSLELRFRKNEEVERIEPAAGLERGRRSIEHAFRMALKDLGLTSGDRLSIRIRAADERPVPEPHVVWSQTWTIGIDDQAEAVGSQALREEDQKLIDQLKALEQQLAQDAERGKELKEQLWQTWDDATRQAVRQLSEKEQQQGRELEQLAEQVAAHPLMKDQADELNSVGDVLRTEIPEPLNDAARADRNPAANKIQEAVDALGTSRERLHQTIEEIENLAKLEADLAELNRLALEADRLAEDARQLEQDQKANEPDEGQTAEELQRELEERNQQLSADRQRLTSDLEELLRKRNELLESARQAQSEKLEALSKQLQQLGQQQQQLADAVQEESRETARDAQSLTDQLQRIRNDAGELDQQLAKNAPPSPRPDLSALDDAIRAMRQGNLSAAEKNVAAVSQEMQKAAASEKKAARDQSAQQAGDIADRLEHLKQQLGELSSQHSAEPSPENAKSSEGSNPADDGNLSDTESLPAQSNRIADDLISRLKTLSDATAALSATLASDPKADRAAAQDAELAAADGNDAVRAARAGEFSDAAQKMEQSADKSLLAAGKLNDHEQQDRRTQLQAMAGEMKQLADTIRQLQQSNSSQAAVRQSTQQDIADQSASLPEQVAELTERLNLPALGMQQQSRQAEESGQAAQQAAQSGQQASEELRQTDLQQAAESGRETAGHLNRAAQLAGQATSSRPTDPGPIPSEVGDSVAEALQNLERARRMARDAEAARRESQAAQDAALAQQQQAAGKESGEPSGNGQPSPDQNGKGESNSPSSPGANPSDAESDNPESSGAANSSGKPSGSGKPGESKAGEPGAGESRQEGSPGEGSPGSPVKKSGSGSESQPLSDAARALADAARGALPQEFIPGQMSASSGATGGKGGQASGNGQGWDGQLPGTQRQRNDRTREWGLVNDELDGEMNDASRDVVDTEYSDLIRRYRRELARAAAGQSADTSKDPPESRSSGSNQQETEPGRQDKGTP